MKYPKDKFVDMQYEKDRERTNEKKQVQKKASSENNNNNDFEPEIVYIKDLDGSILGNKRGHHHFALKLSTDEDGADLE